MTSARFASLKRSTVPTRYPVMRRIRSNFTPWPAFPPSTRNPFHVLPDSHSPILLIPASSTPAATASPSSHSDTCFCNAPSASQLCGTGAHTLAGSAGHGQAGSSGPSHGKPGCCGKSRSACLYASQFRYPASVSVVSPPLASWSRWRGFHPASRPQGRSRVGQGR